MLDEDLRESLALLTEHHVEFLVAGGHAVAFHGYPRFTDDLDLFVRATHANAARIMAALEAFGFGQVGLSTDDFVAADRVIQLGLVPNRIDLLTRLWGVEFEQARAQREHAEIDRVPVAFLARVDLISNKRATIRLALWPVGHASGSATR